MPYLGGDGASMQETLIKRKVLVIATMALLFSAFFFAYYLSTHAWVLHSSEISLLASLSPKDGAQGFPMPASGSSLSCTISASPNPAIAGSPMTVTWSGGGAMLVETKEPRNTRWVSRGTFATSFTFTPAPTEVGTWSVRVSGTASSINTDGHSTPADLDSWTCQSDVVVGTGASFECSDGIDNADPEDTLADRADPGCHSDGNAQNSSSYVATDNDETNTGGGTAPQCSDGIDNADPEDTLADYPLDPGCTSPTDDDETDTANAFPDLVSNSFTVGGGVWTVPTYTPVSFSARAKNISLLNPVTGTFTDIFQYRSGGGAWQTMTTPPAITNLAANAVSVVESANFTPTSAGVYEVRHCVDTPRNDINEGIAGSLEEANNCSAPVTLTVTPTAGGTTVTSCSVSPRPVDVNTPATWTATVSGGVGPYTYLWSGEGITSTWSANASAVASYATAGTKSASVEIVDSLGLTSGTVSCDTWAQETVNPPPIIPRVTLEACFANGSSCTSGTLTVQPTDSVIVKWSTANVSNCGSADFVTGGALNNSGLSVATPPANTSKPYTLRCFDSSGNAVSDTATIQVSGVTTGGVPTISANPTRVNQGSNTTVTVNTQGNTGCTVSGTGIGTNVPVSGTQSFTPQVNGQTDYILSCTSYLNGTPIKATVRITPVIIEE